MHKLKLFISRFTLGNETNVMRHLAYAQPKTNENIKYVNNHCNNAVLLVTGMKMFTFTPQKSSMENTN